LLAASYPFLDLMWTMFIFFLWVMWFWLLITIWTDIFRRDDISGFAKAAWLIFTLVLPYLGVFVYIIAQHEGMTKRNIERARSQQTQFDEYVRETAAAGGAAAEIERAQKLLSSGAITQTEFDAIKARALA
jgi:Phospholipase_D-nuclease N-terminal